MRAAGATPTAAHALFQVMFGMPNTPMPSIHLDDLEAVVEAVDTHTTKVQHWYWRSCCSETRKWPVCSTTIPPAPTAQNRGPMADAGRLFAKDLLSAGRRELLRSLMDQRGLTAPGTPPPMSRRTEPGPVPLSFGQERMWFLHQLDPDSAAYHVAVAVGLRGRLDVAALRQALDQLVRRHESLRTTIKPNRDGTPVQQVHPAAAVELDVIEKAQFADREPAALMREWATLPFDLAEGPLLRLGLLRHSPDEHTLLLCVHHIVIDAWSTSVMVAELAHLYDSFRQGRALDLPEPTHQYADYAVWQRDWLRGERLQRQLDYWRDRLADVPMLEMPTDYPRSPRLSSAGAQYLFHVPKPLRDSLARLSRAEGVTMFMVLLAAFQVLLSRYSGQTDVAVGTSIAGRGRPELEGMIGFFLNTLVLRTDLSGRPSFREVLARTRETALGAYEHQDLPFERLIEELAPHRRLDRTPLFQVMFGLQNTPVAPIELEGLELVPQLVDTRSAMFDLMLIVDDQPDRLTGLMTYRSDLFNEATISRMAEHLRNLLDSVTAHPDWPVDAIELITPQERARLLTRCAGTERAVPGKCLHELVEEQVARSPEAVAVSGDGRQLTYADLNRAANSLARRLRFAGVKPDSRVGILIERSPELVIALLAVLKAGGCCVPLDLSYPPDRLAWIGADAGLAALLVRPGTGSFHLHVPDGAPVIEVRADAADTEGSGQDLPASALPEHLAYVIYTSGSTGRPKGVMIRHSSLVNHMLWMQEAFPLGPSDRVLQKTPIGFDASIWEFWAPLIAGARLVLARPGGERDNVYLVAALREERITTLQVVPGLLDVLMDTSGFATCGLRRLFSGGESLAGGLASRFRAETGAELVNMYGPAEASIDSTLHISGTADRGRIVPVGVPIDNVRAFVLDEQMKPVPDGVAGELYLGGVGLARGYLGRPDLTAAAFVPDPFPGTAVGGRLYRTGDLARWGVRGLEFLGRRDRQVKIRGQRIEPAEIEQALAGHAAIRHVVVQLVADGAGSRLVAYVVPEPGQSMTLVELRVHAAALLPPAMRPEALVLLSELPRSPNGKLDLAALPPPVAQEPTPARAPETALERLLCGHFAAVLERQHVDPDTSFFEAGGNSLQAMRLIAHLRSTLDEAIPVSLLFQAPTPAALAAYIQGQEASGRAHIPRLRRADGPVPLSAAQQRLWFLQRLYPDRTDYNVTLAVRLRGALDVTALGRALTALTERHEVLRTRFEPAATAAHAVAAEPEEVVLDAEESAESLDAVLSAMRQPFDLATGPVWRVRLLRRGPDDHLLVVVVHHVATDTWSGGVMVRDLTALYAAERCGLPSSLPLLPVTYADYAAWQQTWMAGPEQARQLAYWRQRLTGMPRLRLGRTSGVPRADRPAAGVPVVIPPPLRRRVAELGRRVGATPFITVLAVLNVLLYQETGQMDLPVGINMANRPLAQLENLVGLFTNQVVARTQLAGLASFRDLLERTQRVCEEAHANQEVPFDAVVAAVNPVRDSFADPLVDVVLVYDDIVPVDTLDDLVVENIDLPVHTVKHDVDLFLADDQRQINGALHYATDALDASIAIGLRDHLVSLLYRCTAEPDIQLDRLPRRSGRPDGPTSDHLVGERTAPADSTANRPANQPHAALALSDVEHTVARIWEQTLGIEGIGVEDNFFDVGGNSFILLEIAGELQAAFGVEITPLFLLDNPTIGAIAKALAARQPATEKAADVRLDPEAEGSTRARRQREALYQVRDRRTGRPEL